MHMAGPRRSRTPRLHLRRELLQDLLEMPRAVAARVQACKEMDVGPESGAVVFGGLVGELGHHSVQHFPGCVAELCSVKCKWS